MTSTRRIHMVERLIKGTMAIAKVGDGKAIYPKYPGLDGSNGRRGDSRRLAGMKKFVRTRLRRAEDAALERILREDEIE